MSEAGLTEDLTRRARPNEGGASLEDIESRQQHEQEQQAPSPEEALAEAQRQIEEKDRLLAAERDNRTRAERERDEAKRVGSEAITDRVSHQEIAITNALAAGKSKKTAAQAKMRQARENGDFEGESAAIDEISAANFEVMRAEEAKRQFDTWKQRQPKPEDRQQQRQETRQATEPTAEAQRWLDEHPRYTSDAEYRADANASHQAAIESGCMEGSQAYINYIENRMTRLYGDGHGQAGGSQRGLQKPNGGSVNTRQPARAASSTAMAPNRGGSDRLPAGSIEYRDPVTGAALRLVQGADGKETVSGQIPADWVTAAKWNGMSPAAYAVEQIRIQEQMKQGINTGLRYGESGTYK